MSTLRQFNTPISLSSAGLSATHNSNTVANMFTTGGNVGIGTTSPSRKLTIQTTNNTYGWQHTDNTIKLETYIGGTINGGYIGTTSQHPLGFMTNDSSALMFINTNGNVGISTSTPAYTLDINGTLEASNLNGLILFSSSGNVLIGSTTPTSAAFGNGNLMLYGINGANNGITLNGLGNSTLQFLNSGTLKGAVVVIATAGNWSTDSRVGDMVIRCASNQSMLFNTNSGTGVSSMIISGGNVGIGTTSPTQLLDINGSMTLSNFNTSKLFLGNTTSGSARLNIRDAGQQLIEFQYGTSTVGNITCFTSGSGLLFNGGSGANQFVLLSSGNVGIGTTSPAGKLQVNGSNVIINSGDDTTRLILHNNSTGSSIPSDGLQLVHDRLNAYLINYEPNNKLFIANNNQVYITITSQGNVGIGTAATDPKLELSVYAAGVVVNNPTPGLVEFRGSQTSTTTESILRLGRGHHSGFFYGASAEFSIRRAYDSGTNAGSGMDISLGAGQSDNPDTTVMTLVANGNVGVGTTSPASKLHVNGNLQTNSVKMNAGGGNLQMATGNVGSGSGTGSVSFPFTFTNTPNVVASIISSTSSQVFSVNISNITTSGFNYAKTYITTSGAGGGAGEAFTWIAMG